MAATRTTPKPAPIIVHELDRVVGRVHIDRPGAMTPSGRKAIAAWLKSVARTLERGQSLTTGRYTAKYIVSR